MATHHRATTASTTEMISACDPDRCAPTLPTVVHQETPVRDLQHVVSSHDLLVSHKERVCTPIAPIGGLEFPKLGAL